MNKEQIITKMEAQADQAINLLDEAMSIAGDTQTLILMHPDADIPVLICAVSGNSIEDALEYALKTAREKRAQMEATMDEAQAGGTAVRRELT